MNLVEKADSISKLARISMESLDPVQYLSELTHDVITPLEPTGAILGALNKEACFEMLGSYGFPESDTKDYQVIPIWQDLPITNCIRERRVVWISSHTDSRKQYPELNNFRSLENVDVTILAIPLIYRLSVIGSIGFTIQRCSNKILDDNKFWSGFGSICTFYLVQTLQSKVTFGQSIASADLTQRQISILLKFKDGITIEEISEQLHFSNSTVRQEIMRIYKKLGVKDRKSALLVAQEKKII